MANFHSNNPNKKVTFAECISTIREYEYDKTEDVFIFGLISSNHSIVSKFVC